MKRCLIWTMSLLMLLLSACGGDKAYEVKQEGQTFTVNPVERTVSWEGNDTGGLVVYDTGSDRESDWVELTYPDGSTFRRYWQGGLQYETASETYDPTHYPAGEVLLKMLGREVISGGTDSRTFGCAAGLLFLGMGGFYALVPRWALERRTGGASADVTAGSLSVKLTRLLGFVGMAVGAVILAATFLLA